MKKILLMVMISVGFLTACNGKKADYSKAEDAYNHLIEKENISYEVQYIFENEAEKQTYVVKQQGEDQSYELYVGEGNLLQEGKWVDGKGYIRYKEGEWLPDTTEFKPSFLEDMLVDDSCIEKIHTNGKQADEITVTLNKSALEEMKQDAVSLGEEALIKLEEMNALEEAIKAQREKNEELKQTTYYQDERQYFIDENGVLKKYRRELLFEQPNAEKKLEKKHLEIIISIQTYE